MLNIVITNGIVLTIRTELAAYFYCNNYIKHKIIKFVKHAVARER